MKTKDTGYKQLGRSALFNFLKWGEYMKRAQIAERKVEVLTAALQYIVNRGYTGAEFVAQEALASVAKIPEGKDA